MRDDSKDVTTQSKYDTTKVKFHLKKTKDLENKLEHKLSSYKWRDGVWHCPKSIPVNLSFTPITFHEFSLYNMMQTECK